MRICCAQGIEVICLELNEIWTKRLSVNVVDLSLVSSTLGDDGLGGERTCF